MVGPITSDRMVSPFLVYCSLSTSQKWPPESHSYKFNGNLAGTPAGNICSLKTRTSEVTELSDSDKNQIPQVGH